MVIILGLMGLLQIVVEAKDVLSPSYLPPLPSEILPPSSNDNLMPKIVKYLPPKILKCVVYTVPRL